MNKWRNLSVMLLSLAPSFGLASDLEQLLINNLKNSLQADSCQKNFGITLPDQYKWSKKNVSVCWASAAHQNKACRNHDKDLTITDHPNAKKFKKDVKTAIMKEYTLERTGIHFEGWEECDPSKPSDVMLFMTSFVSPNGPGAQGESCIGPCAVKNYKGSDNKSPYVILGPGVGKPEKMTSEEDFKFVAIHEFGHLAGLYHEQLNNPDYMAIHNAEPTNIPIVSRWDYDESSVMNYNFNATLIAKGTRFVQKKKNRFLNQENNLVKIKSIDNDLEEVNVAIGLSDGDVNTLKCLYVKKCKEKN